jgi:hypothetical protein
MEVQRGARSSLPYGAGLGWGFSDWKFSDWKFSDKEDGRTRE